MIVGAVVAAIGVVGSVTAAVISSGGDDGSAASAQSGRAQIVIQTVSFATARDGTLALRVRGVARGLEPTDTVYAMARPQHPSSASRVGEIWFVSRDAKLQRDGRWSATVHVALADQPFTVVAVQVPVLDECHPRPHKACPAEIPPPAAYPDELERDGPGIAGGAVAPAVSFP